jgi:hypothetical protein
MPPLSAEQQVINSLDRIHLTDKKVSSRTLSTRKPSLRSGRWPRSSPARSSCRAVANTEILPNLC